MLEKLEDSLSCLICKELLEVPEQANCDHAFCAICIRRHLTADQHCPVCHKEMHAGALKRVRLLENVVEEYKRVREGLQNLIKPRESTQSSSSATEMGQCPVCLKELPIEDIQGSHIVDCLNPKRKPEFKRRPIANYSILKDKDLKALLMKDGLSVNGNRQKMIARHTEWTLQWNVNAQRESPATIMELRQNLHRWEAALAQKQQKVEVDGWATEHHEMYRELEKEAFDRLGRSGPRKRRLSEIVGVDSIESTEAAPAAQ